MVTAHIRCLPVFDPWNVNAQGGLYGNALRAAGWNRHEAVDSQHTHPSTEAVKT